MNAAAGILGAFAAMGLVCIVAWIVSEVRKGPGRRNRRRGLPPPSDACRRNGTQAVP